MPKLEFKNTKSIGIEQLAKRASVRSGLTIIEQKRAIKAFLVEIEHELLAGNRVMLRRFGSFGLKTFKMHDMINLQHKNKTLKSRVSVNVYFKPGQTLKMLINQQFEKLVNK